MYNFYLFEIKNEIGVFQDTYKLKRKSEFFFLLLLPFYTILPFINHHFKFLFTLFCNLKICFISVEFLSPPIKLDERPTRTLHIAWEIHQQKMIKNEIENIVWKTRSLNWGLKNTDWNMKDLACISIFYTQFDTRSK